MRVFRLFPLLALALLAGCSDQRATFEINGGAHSLSLIRITRFPWEKTAQYSLVAARMPDCMRKHAMPDAGLEVKTEVFSPGNDAWIIRQGGRMYVTETRTCQGFAKLDKAPDEGLGDLVGAFEVRGDTLVFTPAPKAPPAPPVAPVPPAAPSSEASPVVAPAAGDASNAPKN